MPRPFRFEAPEPVAAMVSRQRLIERIDRRWDTRLVTVVAGPGFGKTTLLASALTKSSPARRDVWLSCEPADESADHLASGIAAAVGLAGAATTESIAAGVWSLAPATVCLVLDDVHEIPSESTGAALLRSLIDDLPRNARMVLASRDVVPVPTARLAAAHQLVRVTEHDLAFDGEELERFATTRAVDASLLRQSAGWPALAELTATAGADLVLDYLWEEVLGHIGPERARLLAGLAAVGGGDDEVVTALADRDASVDDVVAGVPLVLRSDTWTVPHPLWTPALRRVLSAAERSHAQGRAADLHRRRRRFGDAIELLAEAGAWPDLIATLHEALLEPDVLVRGFEAARWADLVPHELRDEPDVLFARGIGLEASAPRDALPVYQSAAAGFRSCGDVDGELEVIAHEGMLYWWGNDVAGLFALYQRVAELAAAGSQSALGLNAICIASVGHLQGDSPAVHRALQDFDGRALPMWRDSARWLRSVAHRRDGDLTLARRALETGRPPDLDLPQERVALARTDWLDGLVEEACAVLTPIADDYEASGDRVLARDILLELAAKSAWLGEVELPRRLMERAARIEPNPDPSALDILIAIAEVSLAISAGDEEAAAARVTSMARSAVEGPLAWYWRDRAATAIVYVFVPHARAALEAQATSETHRPGPLLANALVAARENDLRPIAELVWPPAGVVRAHLPGRWVVELMAAATAAGNPPPRELADTLRDRDLPALREAAASDREGVAAAARGLLAGVPSAPGFRLRIAVLGNTEISRDGAPVHSADLRRQRVRELVCVLAVHRLARRREVSLQLWPDLDDGGRNLRVTLNYLQRGLEPDRADGDPPYFVRSDGSALRLAEVDGLEVDLWELERELDRAESAERAGDPAGALACYASALPLWRGEPFADAPDADWVMPARASLRARYCVAAIRAGELLLASGDSDGAGRAAHSALTADRYHEPGWSLLVRAHLAGGDRGGAARTVQECTTALAELGVTPQPDLVALVHST